jgi:CRP-like cAMP-binding protein
MEITMYDNLLQLPLFQGMRKEDFTTILERVKFHFISYKPNETIIRQGTRCDQLFFLLNGSILAHTADKEHNYALSEVFKAPYIIEPYSLFGMDTCFKATYQANEEAKLLSIDKQFIYNELNNYEIFRLNYLNMLSNRCQTASQKLWNGHIGTLEEKFASFLLNRCQRPDGKKYLQITMEDLGNLINETRINVSRMLNDLQQKGLLQLKRKEIYIPALDKLTEHLS